MGKSQKTHRRSSESCRDWSTAGELEHSENEFKRGERVQEKIVNTRRVKRLIVSWRVAFARGCWELMEKQLSFSQPLLGMILSFALGVRYGSGSPDEPTSVRLGMTNLFGTRISRKKA
jgi:hypothetical protein